MNIKKILCPTDLSGNSRSGIAYAVPAAREHRAELVVLHVTRFPWQPLPTVCDAEMSAWNAPVASGFTVERLFQEAELRVRTMVESNFRNQLAGIRWRIRIGIGKVAREIVYAAKTEDADLIIMAKRKKSALTRLFSPSVSEQVSREAPCAVLSVCPQTITPEKRKQWPASGTVLRGSEA